LVIKFATPGVVLSLIPSTPLKLDATWNTPFLQEVRGEGEGREKGEGRREREEGGGRGRGRREGGRVPVFRQGLQISYIHVTNGFSIQGRNNFQSR
jgi:hypothetical protein